MFLHLSQKKAKISTLYYEHFQAYRRVKRIKIFKWHFSMFLNDLLSHGILKNKTEIQRAQLIFILALNVCPAER